MVDMTTCAVLPWQLLPSTDSLQGVICPRPTNHGRSDGRLGLKCFQFSPPPAKATATVTVNSRRWAAIALAISEQEETTCDLPALPFSSSKSLSVLSWGTVYRGPHETKYWNPTRTYPYTVGYTSIKTYKGKAYLQKIEEGAEEPVFTVESIGEDKLFSSKSPQGVWDDVVEADGQSVKGTRQFGFRLPAIITALQTLAQYQSAVSDKEALIEEKLDVQATLSTSKNKSNILEHLKSDADSESGRVEVISDDENDEENLAGFGGEIDKDALKEDLDDDVSKEVKPSAIKSEHDESEGIEDRAADEEGEEGKEEEDNKKEDEVEDEDEKDDATEEDILHHVEAHHLAPNQGHDPYGDDDDGVDDDDEGHDVEEEDGDERDALSYDEYPPANRRVHIADKSFASDSTGPLLNNYNHSFRSTGTRSSFENFGRFDSADEPDKEDMGATNNHAYYPSDQGRSKVTGRVWRKGEIITSHGKQQRIGRSAREQRRPSSDVSQPRISMASSLDTRPWDASSGKKWSENTRSSQMLLELLQKWNKTRDWNRDSKASAKKQAENKSLKSQVENEPHHDVTWGDEYLHAATNKPIDQNFTSENNPFPRSGNSSLRSHENQERMRATHSSFENGEFAFDDFKIDEDLDQSTEFAIAKLFETVGKKEAISGGSQPPPRLGKVAADSGQKTINHVEKNWVADGVGKPVDMEKYQMRLELAEDTKFHRESEGVKTVKDDTKMEPDASFWVEKKVPNGKVHLTSKEKVLGNQSTPSITRGAATFDKRQAEELELIDSIRDLVGRKLYEDAFLAMKSAKATNAELHVDVYEALLGNVRLDSWQKDVFRHIQDGNSVLVSAPSGAGKTVAADCCLFRNYIEERRTLFVTPSDHLAKEKMHALGDIFGHHHVGGLTMRRQNDHKIVVLSLDSLAKMLQELHGPGGSEFRFFFEGINMVVLDKLHTIGDAKYVNMWEEVFMLLDAKIKVLALTLPASNEDQVAVWINMRHGPCKLVSCRTEPIMKRYLFCNGDGMFPLLDTEGVKLREGTLKISEGYRNSMTKEQLDSFFSFGYDKPTLRHALVLLRSNAMLPALVVFPDIMGCNEALQDTSAALEESLLSDQELAKLEACCIQSGNTHPDLMEHLEQADRDALRRGFAACHDGKLPEWQAFVLNLFQKNILKVLLVSENVIFRTGVMARTIILSATCRATKVGVLPLSAKQALPLFGSAGRRVYDIEGNVIFLQTSVSGESEAASLALKKNLDIVSTFKPSYSLVVNLMAKYPVAKVKQLLSGTFHDVVYSQTHLKEKMLQAMGEKILNCLESKGDFEVKLFQGLTEVNKQKLVDAPVFTRVDIRLTMRSASHGGNVFPGFLLAVIPEKTDSFYMIFGADNNFHILPAGALDHVYRSESPPLDALYKQSTGQILQPPAIPSKEMWSIQHDGTGSYVAAGNIQTEWYVKLLMDYPVHMSAVKEGLQLRKEIFSLDTEVLSLIEERMALRGKQFGNVKLTGPHESLDDHGHELAESDTWKEVMRLLKIMVQADALSFTDSQGAYVKLKPLGMLISRLHNVDNALWLASVLTSSHVRQLHPTEFMAIVAATIPLDTDTENDFNDQRDFSYRATKQLKNAFIKLEVLRKQVAALQGCLTPPLHFSTGFANMLYSWARGKPGTNDFNSENANDGKIAWKLKCVARQANLISRACIQVSVDISEPNSFSSLSMLAKRAEESLSKHLGVVD